MGVVNEIAAEQALVTEMYHRLDTEAAEAQAELSGAVSPERQVLLRRRLVELAAAEDGLVFGRIDHADGTSLHIGRRGIRVDGEPLLVDWRAPAATPFYAATPEHPLGLRRRRHLRLAGRRVTGVSDEILDGSPPGPDDVPGDGPLAEALSAPRTGHMRDAVTTLRAEQDAIVRSAHRGVTVVQGGPGTGKTVVALHRAAYVLFAWPPVAAGGVLVIGPDARFLDYISRVLPSLGEHDARLATRTGITGRAATATEPAAVAREKGRAVLADRMADLVAARRPAPRPVTLPMSGEPIPLAAEVVAEALRAADGRPHNPGRDHFKEYLIAELARHAAAALDRIDAETAEMTGLDLDAAVAEDLRALGLAGTPAAPLDLGDPAAALRVDDDLDKAITELWPRLDPADVVRTLLTEGEATTIDGPSPAAEPELTDDGGAGWTAADLALLDEAAALVDGPPDQVFGHIVVDEAQELTEMDWRVVRRRSPSRSMTVVGDFAQAGPGSTVRTWAEALPGLHLETHTLTVNYRSTAQIIEYAARLLTEIAPAQRPSRSIRHGPPPRELTLTTPELIALLQSETAPTRAVIVPRKPDKSDLPGTMVLGVGECRGLEFDLVVVVGSAEFDDPRDLYVALTRATTRLVVVTLVS